MPRPFHRAIFFSPSLFFSGYNQFIEYCSIAMYPVIVLHVLQISESRLNELKEQPQIPAGASPVEQQQPADETNAILQHVIGTADSAESPFRIKRKDAQPKKGALGFRPLLRSSSKPSQSFKSVTPARSTVPRPELSDLPTNDPIAGSLPEERQLSPSAFRTPAITRSLPQLGAQLCSGRSPTRLFRIVL